MANQFIMNWECHNHGKASVPGRGTAEAGCFQQKAPGFGTSGVGGVSHGSGNAAETMLRMLPAPEAVTADQGAAGEATPSMMQSQCPGLPQPRVPGRPLLITTSKPRGELGLKQSFQSNYSELAGLTHLQVSASLLESALPGASAGVQEPHFLPGFPPDTGFSPVL